VASGLTRLQGDALPGLLRARQETGGGGGVHAAVLPPVCGWAPDRPLRLKVLDLHSSQVTLLILTRYIFVFYLGSSL